MRPLELDWSKLRDPQYREEASDTLYQSLCKTGGILIRHAPLEKNSLESVYKEQLLAFNLPDLVKKQHRSVDGTARTGYIPFEVEVANPGTLPDPKEVWHVSRESIVPNIWIDELPKFKQSIQILWAQLDIFATEFMILVGQSLKCTTYATQIMHEHNSILRMVRYTHEDKSNGCPFLAGAHRDIGLFTIHIFRSHPGYEVLFQNEWQPLDLESNQILITAGDMLNHISNGFFLSSEHRVKNTLVNDRYRHFSGFFVHPNLSSILKCHPQQGENRLFEDIENLRLLDGRAREIKISP
jgi:isopenicillin N synthase-like dioxygenase